ncbi:MAG: dockerin type I repeat-containing protein [Candidatus Zixiibacteriota bacterium]
MKDIAKIKIIGILIYLALLTFDFAAGDQYKGTAFATSLDLISEEYNTGNISLGEKYYYSALSVLDPGKLPDKFISTTSLPIKSGTPIINDALANYDLMDDFQKANLDKLLARPPLDSVYDSPEGFFKIHYSFEFPDSVSDEDLNFNEVPDFVERIGQYADSAFFYYLVYNGYYPPPPDEDGIYDIYIIGMGSTYGSTVKELDGDSSWSDYQSHIRINCNLNNVPNNDDPEGKVIGAQKVTVAHEYFHAVQLAYSFRTGIDAWWVEGGATFYEDILFDEVNDNYQYLPYFFNYPDSFLFDSDNNVSYRDYGDFVFSSFLSEKYGTGIIKSVWMYLRYYNLLPSLDSALVPYGTKMKKIFTEFTVWNYFTGDRNIEGMFYNDAADYPQIVNDIQYENECPFLGVTPMLPPDGLACNYIMAPPNTLYPGLLYILFDGYDAVEWSLSFVGFYGDSLDIIYNCKADMYGKTDCGIYNYTKYDSILFIPNVISQWYNNNSYTFSTVINPFGDADGNGIINILDVTYIINYLYKGGQEPKYHILMADANCDSAINIMDITRIISYLYKGGPNPCQ